jgi:hypothetical protein
MTKRRDTTGRKKAQKPTTPRDCLRCEQSFPSEGPYNRLCTSCRQAINTETEGIGRARIPGVRRMRSQPE